MHSAIFLLLFITQRMASQCTSETLTACDPGNENDANHCLRELLQNGEVNRMNEIIPNLCQEYKGLLVSALEAEMQRLKQLQGELVLGESELQPVIKWGQNISHIFINIKTSHRWDSPPCLNTKKQSTFLNESQLQYINICVVSQQKITFSLKIQLYKLANINGQIGERGSLVGFAVSKNGVGMYSATFQKLEYEIWPFLDKKQSSYALWGDIIERYPNDHKKYEEITKAIMRQRRAKATKSEAKLLIGLAILLLLFI